MKHIMLDLETFGLKPGSVLRSVGAVEFELSGETGQSFYANIDKQSCLDVGLTIDPNTEKWWSQQSAEAQESLLKDTRPLLDVVNDFHHWFRLYSGNTVWAQGANFDPGMWEAAAMAVKRPVPWKFFNVRDTRTAYDIGKLDTSRIPRAGTYHNALDDAKHQVRCVAAAVANRS